MMTYTVSVYIFIIIKIRYGRFMCVEQQIYLIGDAKRPHIVWCDPCEREKKIVYTIYGIP